MDRKIKSRLSEPPPLDPEYRFPFAREPYKFRFDDGHLEVNLEVRIFNRLGRMGVQVISRHAALVDRADILINRALQQVPTWPLAASRKMFKRRGPGYYHVAHAPIWFVQCIADTLVPLVLKMVERWKDEMKAHMESAGPSGGWWDFQVTLNGDAPTLEDNLPDFLRPRSSV